MAETRAMPETVRCCIVITASIPKEETESLDNELHNIAKTLSTELNRLHPEANATIVWETKP